MRPINPMINWDHIAKKEEDLEWVAEREDKDSHSQWIKLRMAILDQLRYYQMLLEQNHLFKIDLIKEWFKVR